MAAFVPPSRDSYYYYVFAIHFSVLFDRTLGHARFPNGSQ